MPIGFPVESCCLVLTTSRGYRHRISVIPAMAPAEEGDQEQHIRGESEYLDQGVKDSQRRGWEEGGKGRGEGREKLKGLTSKLVLERKRLGCENDSMVESIDEELGQQSCLSEGEMFEGGGREGSKRSALSFRALLADDLCCQPQRIYRSDLDVRLWGVTGEAAGEAILQEERREGEGRSWLEDQERAISSPTNLSPLCKSRESSARGLLLSFATSHAAQPCSAHSRKAIIVDPGRELVSPKVRIISLLGRQVRDRTPSHPFVADPFLSVLLAYFFFFPQTHPSSPTASQTSLQASRYHAPFSTNPAWIPSLL